MSQKNFSLLSGVGWWNSVTSYKTSPEWCSKNLNYAEKSSSRVSFVHHHNVRGMFWRILSCAAASIKLTSHEKFSHVRYADVSARFSLLASQDMLISVLNYPKLKANALWRLSENEEESFSARAPLSLLPDFSPAFLKARFSLFLNA